MSQSLIQLAMLARQAAADLIENGGEVNEDFEQILQDIDRGLAVKADKYYSVIEALEDLEKDMAFKEAQFAKAKNTAKNFKKRMKDRIKEAMILMESSKIDGDAYTFQMSRCAPSLDVIDEDEIPDHFFITKSESVLDKEALKKALEDGQFVRGAKLAGGFRLDMKVKK